MFKGCKLDPVGSGEIGLDGPKRQEVAVQTIGSFAEEPLRVLPYLTTSTTVLRFYLSLELSLSPSGIDKRVFESNDRSAGAQQRGRSQIQVKINEEPPIRYDNQVVHVLPRAIRKPSGTDHSSKKHSTMP